MFETKTGILLIAGIGFFVLAFLSNGLVPMLMYHEKEATAEELVRDNHNLMNYYQDLAHRYPAAFLKHVKAEAYDAESMPVDTREGFARATEVLKAWTPEQWQEACVGSLREGRKVYVAEGCWHCHSQFVRPVSNENRRWGPVSKREEYENELQRPVMFGTRRVGPDLSREGGQRGNDWHVVHFFKPRLTSPESVMPEYPWFFEGSAVVKLADETGRVREVEGPVAPNRRGFAIVTYMQWLGSWLESFPDYGRHLGGGPAEGERP